jgi:hypothetical protein
MQRFHEKDVFFKTTNHMRYLAISTIIVLSVLSAKAQGLSAKRDSLKKSYRKIGVNAYSLISNLPADLSPVKPLELSQYFCHGVYAKFFKGFQGYRFSVNYFQSNLGLSNKPAIVDGFRMTGIMRTAELKGGYQIFLSNKRIVPYLFADMRISYSVEKGTIDCPTCQYAFVYDPTFTNSTSVVGAGTGIGLRMKFTSRLTGNIEAGHEYFVASSKRLRDLLTPDINSGLSVPPLHRGLTPLQFSLGFLF